MGKPGGNADRIQVRSEERAARRQAEGPSSRPHASRESAACLGGFLYGSFFGVEDLFPPLFVNPMHNITTVLKMSIFVGVVHICIGWFLAMLNDIHNGKVFLAFAEPFMKIPVLGNN